MSKASRLEIGLAVAGIVVGIASTVATLVSRRRTLELTREQLELLALLSEPQPSIGGSQPESRSVRFDRAGFKRRT